MLPVAISCGVLGTQVDERLLRIGPNRIDVGVGHSRAGGELGERFGLAQHDERKLDIERRRAQDLVDAGVDVELLVLRLSVEHFTRRVVQHLG